MNNETNTILKEKWPYLSSSPTNIPLEVGKQGTKIAIERWLNWVNESFEDIKRVLNEWKISFSSWLWALGPIWIVGDIKKLNREELIEVSYRFKNTIKNKNPRHDTNLYSQIAWAIEETLFLLWIEYKLERVVYSEWWHSKSVEIPLPIKKDQV